MKIRRLWIKKYKNIRDCTIEFSNEHSIFTIIGINGSGKSNLIEAIVQILVGIYFKENPNFEFSIDFEAQSRYVKVNNSEGNLSISVDGYHISTKNFRSRLRNGMAQTVYPESTFIYYSGQYSRIYRLLDRYQGDFRRLNRKDDGFYQPLFTHSDKAKAEIILLSLFGQRIDRVLNYISVSNISNIILTLQPPRNYISDEMEPEVWGTSGILAHILSGINDTCSSREEIYITDLSGESKTLRRIYEFKDSQSLLNLADNLLRLGINIYVALEQLRYRNMLLSTNYKLERNSSGDTIGFEDLSEGEKQLISVIGGIYMSLKSDNLILLDEPDTHLNPQWLWEYSHIISLALQDSKANNNTVIMTTHDPVMISGLFKEQVFITSPDADGYNMFINPRRDPKGQGIANILSSNEFFGLPSSLDRETQKLLDERLHLSKKVILEEEDKSRLKQINKLLEFIKPGISERDPNYVKYLRREV